MIDSLLIELSNNKIFAGCILLMTNIGGRYLAIDLPQNLDKMFTTNYFLRCIVLFSIFFMATRDIKTSILLSLLFFIVTHYFINEKSNFCLVNSPASDIKKNGVSIEDYKKAKEIISKYQSENK